MRWCSNPRAGLAKADLARDGDSDTGNPAFSGNFLM